MLIANILATISNACGHVANVKDVQYATSSNEFQTAQYE